MPPYARWRAPIDLIDVAGIERHANPHGVEPHEIEERRRGRDGLTGPGMQRLQHRVIGCVECQRTGDAHPARRERESIVRGLERRIGHHEIGLGLFGRPSAAGAVGGEARRALHTLCRQGLASRRLVDGAFGFDPDVTLAAGDGKSWHAILRG